MLFILFKNEQHLLLLCTIGLNLAKTAAAVSDNSRYILGESYEMWQVLDIGIRVVTVEADEEIFIYDSVYYD